MILRFHNHEAASLLAARMRSEGYFACTLDAHVSHLWGPHPVGGARVLLSEEPIGEAKPPEAIVWSRVLLPTLRTLAIAWVLAGLVFLAARFFQSPSPQPGAFNPSALLPPVVTACSCLAVSLAMIRWTRDDRLRLPGETMRPLWFWSLVIYHLVPWLLFLL